jgi:hypothetical protein
MIGLPTVRLQRHSIMKERPEPFGPPKGSKVVTSWDRWCRVPGRPFPTQRDVAAGVAGTHYFPHCDIRGRHVEDERRPALGRKGDRERIARHARHLGAVVGHHRTGGRHHDARHSGVRGLQREVTDGPGMGDVARGAPAEVNLPGTGDGLVHRPRHRDRSRRTIRVQYRDGAGADLHAHVGGGLMSFFFSRST